MKMLQRDVMKCAKALATERDDVVLVVHTELNRTVGLTQISIVCSKVNEPVTQGLRPLHYAVWQRYPEAARLLLVRGGDVNARDECGYSALHLSAEHGYFLIL